MSGSELVSYGVCVTRSGFSAAVEGGALEGWTAGDGPQVLLLHGGQDRVAPSSHARWLATRIPSAELWLRPDAGHISVPNSAEAALDWLLEHT